MSIENDLQDFKLNLLGCADKVSESQKKLLDGFKEIAYRLYQLNDELRKTNTRATLLGQAKGDNQTAKAIDKEIKAANNKNDQPFNPNPFKRRPGPGRK